MAPTKFGGAKVHFIFQIKDEFCKLSVVPAAVIAVLAC